MLCAHYLCKRFMGCGVSSRMDGLTCKALLTQGERRYITVAVGMCGDEHHCFMADALSLKLSIVDMGCRVGLCSAIAGLWL